MSPTDAQTHAWCSAHQLAWAIKFSPVFVVRGNPDEQRHERTVLRILQDFRFEVIRELYFNSVSVYSLQRSWL